MPLSEEELRLLEQMERALAEEDPTFASKLRGTALRRSNRRRAVLSGIAFIGGVGLLMTGVIAQMPVIGIIGFVVMLITATWGVTALRGERMLSGVEADAFADEEPAEGLRLIQGGRGSSKRRTPRGGSSSSFLERMEQRWQRRRGQGGRW